MTSPNTELSRVFMFPNPSSAPEQERSTLRDHVMDLELLADTVEALDVEDLSPELREELTQDVTRAISGTREKVDIVSSTLAYFEAAQAAAISEIERLTKRHAYFARAQSRLEQYCVSVIETSKFTKLEGRISTLSTRQNPPSVVIAEGTVLPERFMRQPATPAPTADKSAIRTSLKHGATIEGCALVATTRLVRA